MDNMVIYQAQSSDPWPMELSLDNVHLTVQPGRRIVLSGMVSNHSQQPERVVIQIGGIPDDWVRDLPFPMTVDANQEQIFNLAITPPKTPKSKEGQYEITVSAISKISPNRVTHAQLILTMLPFYEFSSDLWPDEIQSKRLVRVKIRNKGNSPQTYIIRGRDHFQALSIIPPHKQLTLQPWQTGKADFQITVRRRPWIGLLKDYPFSFQVVPAHGNIQKHVGVVVSNRLISGWVIFAILVMLCLIPGALIFRGEKASESTMAQAAQVPLLSTVPATLVPDNDNSANTSDPTDIPKLEFTSPGPGYTITSGESVTLKWTADENLSLFLNGEPVTGTEKIVRPNVTTTYVLTGTLPISNTQVVNTSTKISVVRQETITFHAFPNGNPVPLDYIFQGDEFSAQGVEFTIEGDLFSSSISNNTGNIDNNSCDIDTVKKPAIGVAADYAGTHYLTTFVPKVIPWCEECEINFCKSVPVSIKFLKAPVQYVTVTYLHPSGSAQVLRMKNQNAEPVPSKDGPLEGPSAQDGSSQEITPTTTSTAFVTEVASKNLRFRATFPYTDIARVDIGMDQDQPPEITKIEYWYLTEEDCFCQK